MCSKECMWLCIVTRTNCSALVNRLEPNVSTCCAPSSFEMWQGAVQSGPAEKICSGVAYTACTKGSASGGIFSRMSTIAVLFAVLNALEKWSKSRLLSSDSKFHQLGRRAEFAVP